MSWKITLKNGEIIANPDFYQVEHYKNYWNFKKRTILKRKVTTGHFWWRKESEETEEEMKTLLVIPIRNILKIEQIDDTEEKKEK